MPRHGRRRERPGRGGAPAAALAFLLVLMFAIPGRAASPAVPIIFEPKEGSLVHPADVHMEAPFYSDPDGDTHVCSDWEIVLDSTGEVVWARACATGSLRTHIHLPDGTFQGTYALRTELDHDTDYRLRVRFHDSAGEASGWAERPFRTLPPGPPGQPGPIPWTVEEGYEVEIVATGFAMPTNIAFVPSPGLLPSDPYFYVVELHGTIKVVTRDGTVSVYATNLLNFSPLDYDSSAQQGVGGIVVEPLTGDLFVSLLYQDTASTAVPKPKYPKVIRLHSIDGGMTAATETTVIDMFGDLQEYSHQISNLTIGPDGKLYVHNGDGITNSLKAQNLQSWGDKILRSNLDGTAPSDNPFYDAGDGITPKDYVWAYGFRNPFGGAWRASDGGHYEVENGPTVDRFAKVVAGRDYDWGDSSIDRDVAMQTYAIYNWDPAHAPVNIAFIQPETFGGSGFPSTKHDHAFVTESGPTYATGTTHRGKRIVEFVVGPNENLISGPTTFVEYTGIGKASAGALAAGPDGLYFSDLYQDASTNPLEPGANILRIRHVGHSASPAASAPANTSPPSVSGTAREGETLTAAPGGWSGTAPLSYSYRWQRCSAGGPSSYADAVLADRPLAFWRFEDSSGTVAADSSGSGRDGIYRGGATLGAQGVAGSSAVALDGVDDHVEVPGSAAPSSTAQLTVEAWVKSGSASWNTSGYVASKRRAYVLHPNSGSKTIGFRIWIGTTELKVEWTPPAGFDLQQWHHYAGTYDGSRLRLYADGVERASAAASGSIPTDRGPLYLGRDGGFARYGNASLDEVAVYGTALTAERIAAHFEAASGGGGGCANVPGATQQNYLLGPADVGFTIRVVVTATNAYGQATASSGATAVVQAGSAPPQGGLPSGFSQQVLVAGLVLPTDFAFLPDGSVLVAELRGLVKRYAGGVVTTFLDIRSRVNSFGERGLLGIAVDPAFGAGGNGSLYAYYVYEDGTPPADSPKTVRLTKFTVSSWSADPASEVVLLGTASGTPCNSLPAGSDCIPSDFKDHHGGTIQVASDGTILLSTGDGSTAFGVNEKALRAQDLDSLAGKVLRVSTTGAGLPDNPFWNGNPASNRSKVYAYGFRNPFRFGLRPGSDRPYLGDVGWNSLEEIDVVVPGGNYGWPCYEGTPRQAGYEPSAVCQALYAQGTGAVKRPLVEYSHAGTGASVTGGAFYAGTQFPTEYRGAYFYADYAAGWIRYLHVDANDALLSGPTVFLADAGGPVALRSAPDGSLAYLSIYPGELRRIRYTLGNTFPTAAASGAPASGAAPLAVQFSSAGSTDPDGDPLQYSWDFGDGTDRSSAASPSHVYGADGTYQAVLTVSDGRGGSATAAVTITVGNTPPSVTIDAPLPSAAYAVGDEIAFSASATDAEDGPLPGSALAWEVELLHCPGGNCHSHPLLATTGSGATIRAPDHGDDTYLRFTATATDSGGLTGSASLDLLPRTVTISLDTVPSGLQLVYDGTAVTTPFARQTPEGSLHAIHAPSPQGSRVFASWSDGGAQQHDVVLDTGASFVATFATADPPANTSPPTISGPAVEGGTLTAARGSWSGTEPLSYSYHWERCSPGGGSSYAEAVLADGPLGFWRFEESSGTTAADSSGNGRDGVYQGGPALGAAGVAGSAVALDGSNDDVEVPGSVAPNPTQALTVEAWVKSSGASWDDSGFVASKRRAYVLHPNAGQQSFGFRIFIGTSEHTLNWTPPAGFDIRDWHHYAGSYDGSTQRLYVDGIERASAARSGPIKSDGGALYLGRDDGFSRYGNATLDEIAVYGTALSAGRLAAHVQAATGGGGGGGGGACADISGADQQSYQPTGADVDSTVRVVVTATNAHGQAEAPSAPTGEVQPAAAGGGAPLVLAAGDIADCTLEGDEATAALLDAHAQATVLTLGDNVYPSGTAAQFTNCYEPTWGRAKARTRPAPGNHDYETAGAAGYFGYFGAAAGPADEGYYSFDLGDWHIVSLNSNCAETGGCGPGSAQEQWLRADLAANAADCTMAYWHHARFSSGEHGNDAATAAFWQALYEYGADLILVGHDHDYERFAPQTPAAAADAVHGIRQLVVGTGGAALRPFGTTAANSQVREYQTWGVLKLVLRSTGYDWEFLAEAGKSFTDSGSDDCSTTTPPPPSGSAPVNTALPSVSGPMREGETVSADPGSWTDADSFAYQWQRCSPGGGGKSYADAVLADGPLGFWRFEESSGTTAADSSGNGRDGVYQGGPALGAAGVAGSAVALDGSNDHVEVPGSVAPSPTGALTVEAWVKSSGASWDDSGFVASKRRAYVLHPNAGSTTVGFRVYVGTSEYKAEWTPPSGFDIREWHHYVGTYDGSQALLYVDGVLRASASGSGPIKSDSGPLFLGHDDGFPRYGAATLDEIAVYGTALPASRVDAHYQAASGGGGGPAGPCTDIAGADQQSHQPTGADVGHGLKVLVTATNVHGQTTAASPTTPAVEPAGAGEPPPSGSAPVNTALPSIAGTPREGETLTADPGAWTGADSFAYRWQRCPLGGGGGSYAEAVLADGPLGFWRFEESSGTTAADSSGNGRNGVYQGGPALGAAGVAGSAVALDGSNDQVEVPGSVAPSPTQALTVEAWVKSSGASWDDSGFVASKRRAYVLHPNAGQQSFGFRIFIGTSEHTLNWTPPAGFDIRAWHHYAGTYDGSTQRLYVDGIERASAARSGPIKTDGGSLYLGRDDGFSRYGNATLDEIAVYGTALPASRLAAHVQAATSGGGGGGTCTDIAAATGQTYQPTGTDVGHGLKVLVTAGNAYGQTTVASPTTPTAAASLPPPPPPPSETLSMGPLRQFSSNPRYFTADGLHPVFLTGSHTWSTLVDRGATNPPAPFDYDDYINKLKGWDHNFVRLWAWEQTRDNDATRNAEVVWNAPQPWVRTGSSAALDGMPQFDLNTLNQDYFDRLRQRVVHARNNGIYVGIMLFEGYVVDKAEVGPDYGWNAHPMHVSNNINGVNGDPNDDGRGREIHQLPGEGGLQAINDIQKAYVGKVIDTVNDLDNVLFEIANEAPHATTGWQYDMINFIRTYEAGLPNQHPIGMTFQWANGNNETLFNSPADWISTRDSRSDPPVATGAKVIISDSDHHCGSDCTDGDWVWRDFTRGRNPIYMDSWDRPTSSTLIARNEDARKAMGQTHFYAKKMTLGAMTPRGDLASTGFALANPGVEYVVYQPSGGSFSVDLSASSASFSVEWLDSRSGSITSGGTIAGGASRGFTPPFSTGRAILYLKKL